MEIEKLIEGETYYVKDNNFWMIGIVTLPNYGNNTRDVLRGNATLINSDREFKNDISWCYKGPNRTYRLATELEKYQLQCSIGANRYIDAVEAMLSFTSKNRFKPSTKEAYEAQFPVKVEKLPRFKVIKNIRQLPSVVENDEGNEFRIGDVVTTTEGPNKGKAITIIKFRYTKFRDNICAITDIHRSNGIGIHKLEHVIVKDQFVLPEKWFIKITDENRQLLIKWRKSKNNYAPLPIAATAIIQSTNYSTTGIVIKYHKIQTEITLEQFKKYVLKENEPVVEVIEETLLEKANRLYPIGTVYINTVGRRNTSQGNVVNYKDGSNNIMLCSGSNTGLIYKNGQWAEIIK